MGNYLSYFKTRQNKTSKNDLEQNQTKNLDCSSSNTNTTTTSPAVEQQKQATNFSASSSNKSYSNNNRKTSIKNTLNSFINSSNRTRSESIKSNNDKSSSKNSPNKSSNSKGKNQFSLTRDMSVILQPTVKQTASVIFLHGLGDTGHGWSAAFAAFRKPYIKYVFPTAPIRPVTLNGGFEMTAWFDILGLRPDAGQDEEGIKSSSEILMNLVQEEIKNGIPSERIFIGGFSQGGATALYTALTAPLRFAGVIALSTWLPLHNRFPASLTPFENKFTTPILHCHGDADSMVPLEWGKLSAKALQSMGFTNTTFKIYRGMGHSSSDEELDDVDDYIKKIVS